MKLSRNIKLALLGIAVLAGVSGIKLSLQSLAPEAVYRKDFIQEYLLAKAVIMGVNPYLQLPELAQRLAIELPTGVFAHPTPHTPSLALLSLPLGFLKYEHAAGVQMIFQLGCLLASVILLLRWWRKIATPGTIAVVTLAALGWRFVYEDLALGQINLLLVLLMILAWLFLRDEKEIPAGIMLGGLLALKLAGLPIILFLLLRRKWLSVAMATTTAIAFNLAAAAAMGINAVVDYYARVGPTVAALYRAHAANFSTWTFSWRLFSGTGSPVLHGLAAPPLFEAPKLAAGTAFILPIIILVIGVALALKARRFDTSFSVLVCAGILISPIAWDHYLILCVIPMVVIARRLTENGFPRKELFTAVLLWMATGIPYVMTLQRVVGLEDKIAAGETAAVPFVISAITLIPAMAVFGWMWMVWQTERTGNDSAINAELH